MNYVILKFVFIKKASQLLSLLINNKKLLLPLHVSTRRETNERGNGPLLVARALARTNAPARAVAIII